MTETTLPLIDLLQKQDDGDLLRAVAEAVLQLLMEHDVEGQTQHRSMQVEAFAMIDGVDVDQTLNLETQAA